MIKAPMLAVKAENIEDLEYPLIASPKLDGIRCLIIDGVAYSRKLKPIPNQYIQKFFSNGLYDNLDGEIIVGNPTAKDVFQVSTSGVMSEDGEPDFRFWVFDSFANPDQQYLQRLLAASTFSDGGKHIAILYYKLIASSESLSNYEEWAVDVGYEGVMTRHPKGLYKSGRSTLKQQWLLKIKRFEDSEAIILGAEEQMHNANEAKVDALGHTERSSHKANLVGMNTLGAFLVRDMKTGVEFSIGTGKGLTKELRKELWEMHQRGELQGKIAKYSYQPSGEKEGGKRRFPSFLGLRSALDMD